MPSTVLIGRNQHDEGVVSRIFGFPDLGGVGGGQVRSLLSDTWSLINDARVVPVDSEWVAKMSRSPVRGNEVWTYVGLYRAARYPSTHRGIAYMGAGFAAPNVQIDAERCVYYLKDVLSALEERTTMSGQVIRSIFDPEVGALFGPDGRFLRAELHPGITYPAHGKAPLGNDKVFIDLSPEPVGEFFHVLPEALNNWSNSSFAQLMVGDSGSMAARAHSSGAFKIVVGANLPSGTVTTLPPLGLQRMPDGEDLLKPRPVLSPSSARPPGQGDEPDASMMGELLLISQRLDFLTRAIETMSHRIQAAATTTDAGTNGKPSFRRWGVLISTLALILVACVFAILFLPVLTNGLAGMGFNTPNPSSRDPRTSASLPLQPQDGPTNRDGSLLLAPGSGCAQDRAPPAPAATPSVDLSLRINCLKSEIDLDQQTLKALSPSQLATPVKPTPRQACSKGKACQNGALAHHVQKQ